MESLGDLRVQVPLVLHIIFHRDAAAIVRLMPPTRMIKCKFPYISSNSNVTRTEVFGHASLFVARVFHDHQITTEPCSRHYILSTPNNALCHRDKQYCREACYPISTVMCIQKSKHLRSSRHINNVVKTYCQRC